MKRVSPIVPRFAPVATRGCDRICGGRSATLFTVGAGNSQDARQLGFALGNAETSDHSQRPNPVRRLGLPGGLNAKRHAADVVLGLVTQLHSRVAQRPAVPQVGSTPASTVSVVIPERGNPAMLSHCLQALDAATARLSMDVPVVVIVNGARRRLTMPAWKIAIPMANSYISGGL